MIPVSPKKKLFLMMQDQSSQISNCKENFGHIYAETVKLPLIKNKNFSCFGVFALKNAKSE